MIDAWQEGTYSEKYPDISQDTAGMRRLFRQFSFPGGIPRQVAPETPGSIHEGCELGYSLAHANGGELLRPLPLPDFRDYSVEVKAPAGRSSGPTRVLGTFLCDVIAANPRTFRLMGPDETASNRLQAVFASPTAATATTTSTCAATRKRAPPSLTCAGG